MLNQGPERAFQTALATSRASCAALRRWTTLPWLLIFAILPGGCATVNPGIPAVVLSERILPPLGVEDELGPPPAEKRSQLRNVDENPAAKKDHVELCRATLGWPVQVITEPASPVPVKVVATSDAQPLTLLEPSPTIQQSTSGLTLPEAIGLAFRNQPRLRVYQDRVEEARGRGQAAFAPFLPSLALFDRGFVGHNPTTPRDRFALPLPEFSDAPGYQNYAVSELFLQWTLWDFGRTLGRYRQAELGIDIAQLQWERTSQTVIYDVSASYFLVLRAQAVLRVAQDAVRLAQSILDVSRKSLQQGEVLRDAVLRSEVQLAQARRQLVTAERNRLVAVAALNQAIGINVSGPTEIADRNDEPPFGLKLAECLQTAVGNRKEFLVAQRAIEAAAEAERVTKAEFAPRVYFEGVAAESTGNKSLIGASETASINITWKLYQGGQRIGDLRSANAALRAAGAQAEVVCDTIAFEVNEAYRDVEAAHKSIELARPAVTQASENLRLVTLRFERGNATPTDTVDAQTSLTRARQDLYTSQYDYLTSLARLDYAMGTAPYDGTGSHK
jgi:outer membrane protein